MMRQQRALALVVVLASMALQTGCNPAASPAPTAVPTELPKALPNASSSVSPGSELLINQRAALEKAGQVEAIGLQHDADQRRAIDAASR